jgi:far upstream element-binding protein
MGKGGETIKQICQQSGAHCQVDKNAPDTAKEKNILIKGTPDAIEQAKRMIAEKVGGGYGGGGDNYNGNYRQNDQPYGGGFDGGPPQGGYGGGGAPPTALPQPGGVQVNPATGQPVRGGQAPAPQQAAPAPAPQPSQPDYSAQWAEYYRSIGKIAEAEAIEKNMRAKSGSVPPAGYPQPGYGAPQPGFQQPGYY